MKTLFSAMYPHIVVAFNIERNTMIGKLFIDGFDEERYDHIYVDQTIYDNSGDDDDDAEWASQTKEPEILKKYDAGRDFMDNLLTGDTISIGSKWFNLPNYSEVLEDFKKEFKIKPKKRITFRRIVHKFAELLNIKVG